MTVLDGACLAAHPDLTALERELAGLAERLADGSAAPRAGHVDRSHDGVRGLEAWGGVLSDAEASGQGEVGPWSSLLDLLDAPPSPDVAAGLLSHDPADLGGHDLVEMLAAWERISAWAQGRAARALCELLERARGSVQHEFVVDEVAARLALSRHAAEQHVTVAHGVDHLPEVADAMAAGLVDRRKAEVLVATGRLDDDQRRSVIREVRPDLEHLTVRQLRERLRRAEITVDPEGAAERHGAARRTRSVVLEPVDDAMAYLTAYLPADDAARAFAAIDGAAVALHRIPGDDRRLDECRADAFVALITGATAFSAARSDGTTAEAVVPRPATVTSSGSRVSVRVVVAATTLLGADDAPAVLAGYGPIPAPMARALAADPEATWQRILTDPATGVLTDLSSRTYRPGRTLRAAVVARDENCRFPGCHVPARRGDLDHVVPFDPGRDGPQTSGDNLHALCRTHHRARTFGGWGVEREPASGVTRWRSPTGHDYSSAPNRAAEPCC